MGKKRAREAGIILLFRATLFDTFIILETRSSIIIVAKRWKLKIMNLDDMLSAAKAAFPDIRKNETFNGLQDDVEVIWDKWGIPHLYGSCIRDLYYVQGILHAKNRLWQMDLFSRKFRGELSEILGESTVEGDKHARTIGFHRMAKKYAALLKESKNSEVFTKLRSYCQGVNDGVRSMGENVPVEFKILDIRPREWDLANVLILTYMLDWVESIWNVNLEIVREHLILEHGEKNAERLIPLHRGTKTDGQPGSNAWALSPKKSNTGNAILCSDPHLAMTAPCLWYLIHLNCPGMDVIGVSIPGAPGIIIGHNDSIGWGITNVQGDNQDLFRLEINPDNPMKYKIDGQWVEAEKIIEKIKVRGESKEIEHEVLTTHFGPVINSHEKFQKLVPLTLPGTYARKWSGFDANPGDSLLAFLKLNQAKNWDEFREALRLKSTCPHNFIFADINGNIGHQQAGVLPIRKNGVGTTINPGNTLEYDWTGYSKFDKLKSDYNPKRGFVYSANFNEEKIHNGILIAMDSIGVYRTARLKDLLQSKDKIGMNDCITHQNDATSYEAREIFPEFMKNVKIDSIDGISEEIKDVLDSWKYTFGKKDVGATLYKVWSSEAIKLILAGILPKNILEAYLEATPFTFDYLFKHYIPEHHAKEHLLSMALENALIWLKDNFGCDIKKWSWGNVHRLHLAHPFSMVSSDAKVLNIGSFKAAGDVNCLNNGHCDPTDGFPMIAGPSYRQILDLGNWDRSIAVIPGGQSGLPFHAHYNDLAKLWAKGKYFPLLFSRKAIQESSEAKQTFQAKSRPNV
ncbi:MAG: penicillin acylase family protein [Promethearchaeota archaeon]